MAREDLSVGSVFVLFCVVATLLTVGLAAPVLRAPNERIFGTEIVGRHHDPFTVMQQFAGAPVSTPYLQPATDWIGRALARIMPTVAAYNVLVLWTFPLAAAFTYLFAYELTRSVAASAIAGLAVAFAPFHVAHAAYHPHIAQVQWTPIYFFALWQCLHGMTATRAAVLVVVSVLVVLSNYYGGLIALMMTPVALLLFWLAPSRDGRFRSWRDLASTSALLLALCTAALLIARRITPVLFEHPAAFTVLRDELVMFSARWWSYFVPPVDHRVLGVWSRRVWESYGMGPALLAQQVYLGFGVLTFAAVALWTWVRERDRVEFRAVPFLAAIAAVALICSLAPERQILGIRVVTPSALIYLVAPMFRVYARLGVVVQLMVALMAAMGMTSLWQRRTRGARVAVLALVGLTAFEYTPLPWRWHDVLPTSAHRWLVRQGGAPRVLDCSDWALAEQATAWLAGYQIGYLQRVLPDCGEPDIAGKLRAIGFTHLLVRAERPEFHWLSARPREGLRASYRADDAAVFEVTAARPFAYVASLEGAYPREYDPARTWRWTSGDAKLWVENLSVVPRACALDIELGAFGIERHVAVSINGRRVTDLLVAANRGTYHIGPMLMLPGSNQLTLRSVEPPIVPASLRINDDSRPLAIEVGEWRWTVP